MQHSTLSLTELQELKTSPASWTMSKVGNDYDQYMLFDSEGKSVCHSIQGKDNALLIAQAPELLFAIKHLAEKSALLEKVTRGEQAENRKLVDALRECIRALSHAQEMIPSQAGMFHVPQARELLAQYINPQDLPW